jgi:uncharacterized protein involved in exopolysaccharide biosynthesis
MNPRTPTREVSISFTLRDLATPLFRCKRVLIATFLCVFATATLLGFLRFHKYESHMVIRVGLQRPDPVLTAEAANQTGAPRALNDREVNSEAELIKAHDLLKQVVLAGGAKNTDGGRFFNLFHPWQTEGERVASAVQALDRQIQVKAAHNANLVKVTYSSSDPALAYGVLKSLSKLYLEKHAAAKTLPGSNQLLAQQVQDSDPDLRTLEQSPGVAEGNKERAGIAQQLTKAVGEFHTIELAITTDEQLIQSEREHLKDTPQTSSTGPGAPAAILPLQSLTESLLTAEAARKQLLIKYEPSDPVVKDADQKVADAKAAIDEAKRNQDANQLTGRNSTIESLRDSLAEDQADLETQNASLAGKQREIESLRSQMIRLGNQPLTVAIATPPEAPLRPIHSAALIFLIAVLIAVLVSLLTTYMTDYFDPSFRTPAEVIDILGVGVVVALAKKTA